MSASLPARLVAEDGDVVRVELENVSAVGLCATGERALAPGARCRIALATPDGEIEAQGTVVRTQGRRMGVRFDVLPFEDFERLRALLLANAGDPAALRDELDDRLGHLLGEDAA